MIGEVGKMIQTLFRSKNSPSGRGGQTGPRSTPAGALYALGRAVFCALLVSVVLTGQEPTPGEKTRPAGKGQTYNAPGATYSGKGDDYQVDPQKAKAIVSAINLEKRSITVAPAKKGGKFRVAEVTEAGRAWQQVDEMELTFLMAPGLEKIMASKSAAKSLGKKSIALEELPVQSEIKVEYYPVPRMILALTVERAGSK
jgi:hypothetical protein